MAMSRVGGITSQHSSQPLALTISLLPLLRYPMQISSEIALQRVVQMVHLGMSTQQSLALSSVTSHRSLCSLLPTGKMRLLRPRQRAALACGHKYQDSEGSVVHVHSSNQQQHVPRPWACDLPRLSTNTGHVFPPTQHCLALIRIALNTLKSVLLLMKQAIPCLSGWYPSMWSQPLSKTINDFLPQLRA